MLKQVKELAKDTDEKINRIWDKIKIKDRAISGYNDGISIGEKVDALIDYLGIEISKTYREPIVIQARKKNGKADG